MPGYLTTPEAAEILGSGLALRRFLCTPMRFPRSGCRACERACDLRALRRDGDRWAVGPSCDRCGACVSACPMGALDLQSPSTAEVEAAVRARLDAAPGSEIVFRCERTDAGGGEFPFDPIRVPCAARLDESTLAGAILRGAPGVRVLLGDCRACDRRGRLRAVLAPAIRAARAVLAAAGADPGRLRLRRSSTLPPAADRGLSAGGHGRRAFFRKLVRSALEPLPPPPPAGSVPGRRRRLVDAYRSRPAAVSLSNGAAESKGDSAERRNTPSHGGIDLPIGRVAIGPDCVGCNVCAHVCATGALQREETPAGQVTLRFDAALCNRCGACAEACFPRALRIAAAEDLSALAPRSPETLAVLDPRSCRVCRESFASTAADLCPRCRCFGGNGALTSGAAEEMLRHDVLAVGAGR